MIYILELEMFFVFFRRLTESEAEIWSTSAAPEFVLVYILCLLRQHDPDFVWKVHVNLITDQLCI